MIANQFAVLSSLYPLFRRSVASFRSCMMCWKHSKKWLVTGSPVLQIEPDLHLVVQDAEDVEPEVLRTRVGRYLAEIFWKLKPRFASSREMNVIRMRCLAGPHLQCALPTFSLDGVIVKYVETKLLFDVRFAVLVDTPVLDGAAVDNRNRLFLVFDPMIQKSLVCKGSIVVPLFLFLSTHELVIVTLFDNMSPSFFFVLQCRVETTFG
jgi:hypothetical protein